MSPTIIRKLFFNSFGMLVIYTCLIRVSAEWIDYIMYILVVERLGLIYQLINSIWVFTIIDNFINKKRLCPNFCSFLFTLLNLNFTLLYVSWYNLIGIEMDGLPYLEPLLIQTLSFILLLIQYYKGSRFFLPSRCRKLAYNYHRKIGQDFDLSKLPEEEWPVCEYCLTKLH